NTRVHLWDTATGAELNVPATHDGAITAIAFLPDGRSLISGTEDDRVTIHHWETETGKHLAQIPLKFRHGGNHRAFEEYARWTMSESILQMEDIWAEDMRHPVLKWLPFLYAGENFAENDVDRVIGRWLQLLAAGGDPPKTIQRNPSVEEHPENNANGR